jgi:hypothetical protein
MDYRAILKRVGFAWVTFGLLDIVLMIYYIMNGQSYSSSFNIFAVIIGIFLIRGSLGATTLVTWLTAFMLTGCIGVILIFPFLQPMGLLLTQAKLNPVSSIIGWLMGIFVLAMLGWTWKQMRSHPVLEARKASGRPTTTPKIAIGLGIVLVAFLGVMLNSLLNGAIGTKAIALARQKLGPNYKYAAQSIRVSGRYRSGIVVAYNDKEIKYVPVHWNE